MKIRRKMLSLLFLMFKHMLSSTVLGIYIFMSEGQHATEILGLGFIMNMKVLSVATQRSCKMCPSVCMLLL